MALIGHLKNNLLAKKREKNNICSIIAYEIKIKCIKFDIFEFAWNVATKTESVLLHIDLSIFCVYFDV